jgi:hypothetical protein
VAPRDTLELNGRDVVFSGENVNIYKI